jgi:hypothetical protein
LKPAIIQSAELVLAEIPSSTVDQQEVLWSYHTLL